MRLLLIIGFFLICSAKACDTLEAINDRAVEVYYNGKDGLETWSGESVRENIVILEQASSQFKIAFEKAVDKNSRAHLYYLSERLLDTILP